ncbi:hypothetical protein Q4O60_13835 [Aeribacillus pallidus]|nr:hypothetical protein [Aeribacillus pallidus]
MIREFLIHKNKRMFYDQTIRSGKERTESIEKTSDAGIEWKKADFFLAAASSMEVARNSLLFME